MLWDVEKVRLVNQTLRLFQQWTTRWSVQMESFYSDWLDSMLLLESRSEVGMTLKNEEREQLFSAIERAQLHDLLRQHVEHVQAFLERCQERYGWNEESTPKLNEIHELYPFSRAIFVLTSIVSKSIDRMADELEHWQSTFNRWESDEELYKVWPDMDLRFSEMHSVLNDGRLQVKSLQIHSHVDTPNADEDTINMIEKAVIDELEPLMRRLRSVYERQTAAKIVNEFELNVGSSEGEVIFFDEEPLVESEKNVAQPFQLVDSLTIYLANEEYRRLSEYLKEQFQNQVDTVVLNGANVVDIDASGIQLIVAVSQTCAKSNIRLVISEPSHVLTHWLQRSGAMNFVHSEVV